MDHYPFTIFIELFCSLNPVQLKEASASPQNRLEFEDKFCRKLKELKLQVITLHRDSDSDELSGRYFNDYLCQYMELLTGQLGPDGAGEYFKKKHSSDYTSFITALLTCVNRDIRNLAEFFGKYFDYDAPAPALTGLEFYLEQKDHFARLIRKMKKGVDDAELVQVIDDFIHSFAVKNNHSSRSFSDYRCLHRLGIVMQEILQRKGSKDTGDNLRVALMTRGFNEPAFVMHCLGWLNKKLPAESGRENVLLKLHELDSLFTSLRDDHLQLPSLQSLGAACIKWRDDARDSWLSEEQFEVRVKEELLHRLDETRILTSLSARALAMFARCLHETGVITNKDLEKLLEIWRQMFITVRNNKETAPGSFKKAYYGTDKKIAAILKGVFDTGTDWLNRKTKLNERD